MAKHKQIWVAVILLLIAGFACQSQGVVSSPEPEPSKKSIQPAKPGILTPLAVWIPTSCSG
jgi:hypothetical protein